MSHHPDHQDTRRSNPSKIVEEIEGIHIEVKSYKRNFFFYRDIGTRVKIRGKKKKRWWCLGLCSTRKKVKAREINIQNTYFSEAGLGTTIPVNVEAARHDTQCMDSSDCNLRHFAFGFGVKVKFPADSSPSGVPELPLNGVKGHTVIRLASGTYVFDTAKGVSSH